jgi:hypothetical protein
LSSSSSPTSRPDLSAHIVTAVKLIERLDDGAIPLNLT